MKLDSDPFPINVIEFENKKMLIRSAQAGSVKGENIIVDDNVAPRMIKPKNPEVGVWKVNEGKKQVPRFRPTVKQLLDKYTSRQASNVFNRLGGAKRPHSPSRHGFSGQRYRNRNSYNQQQYREMGSTYLGRAPPMRLQIPPWGYNCSAQYSTISVGCFHQGVRPSGPIIARQMSNKRARFDQESRSRGAIHGGYMNSVSKTFDPAEREAGLPRGKAFASSIGSRSPKHNAYGKIYMGCKQFTGGVNKPVESLDESTVYDPKTDDIPGKQGNGVQQQGSNII
ncbi:uncharacterized protein LOC111258175 [Setaria italica]|uniref:uncharacterized protein LOC111258175 n=1 Tax=Setaria italica TaxID=4555 RepID=UPI000BE57902|nr:uncharacterized protein LOC111258175 [Setaria italica]